MASTVCLSLPEPDPDATDPERPPPALPSELLEEVFLRVASPADLARAATACVSFRRIIADHAFLRRYRSIHPPLLLGRYLLLPPTTDDLLASIGIENQHIFHFGPSFICSGGTEGDTSFSVISWIQSSSRLGVLIFFSGSGWSVSMSISWDDLGLDGIYNFKFRQPQYTSDCVYRKLNGMSRVVKLDLNSLQFCTIGLPPGHERRDIVIVESGELGLQYESSRHICGLLHLSAKLQ